MNTYFLSTHRSGVANHTKLGIAQKYYFYTLKPNQNKALVFSDNVLDVIIALGDDAFDGINDSVCTIE